MTYCAKCRQADTEIAELYELIEDLAKKVIKLERQKAMWIRLVAEINRNQKAGENLRA